MTQNIFVLVFKIVLLFEQNRHTRVEILNLIIP